MDSPALPSGPEASQDRTFSELFMNNPLAMWLYDQETLRFLEVNRAAVKSYGYSRDEFLQMTLADIRPPEDHARLREAIRDRAAYSGAEFHHSPGWRHLKKDGSIAWVDIYSHDFDYGERRVRLVIVNDVTGVKMAAERLQQQNAYFRQLFHNSADAIVVLDGNDVIVDANVSFISLFQYNLDEMRGCNINDLIVPDDRQAEATSLSLAVRDTHTVQRDTVRQRKDGTTVEVTALGYPITIDGQQVGVFAIYRDITESKRIASELAYHSTHDPLTRLINRHEFERRAKDLLRRSARSGSRHALLYMDVDQFKVINDSCGHGAGDVLLMDLAEMLRRQVRDADTLARLGSDEFGVLLVECALENAAHIAQRMVDAARARKFKWGERTFNVGLSIGVVEIGPGSENHMALMSAADTACFTAKERGRSRVQIFRPDDQDLLRMRGELSWATRIMEALEQDRFVLYFQRIVPVTQGMPAAPAKCEILLRILDQNGQIVPPGLFVPAAERYGLMPAIDRRVISRVFERMRERSVHEPMHVSINLSGTSINEEGFATYIREQFAKHSVPAQSVCFEITETAAIANLARALTFITDMRNIGCSIALDDFGAGMSSFNYLKSLAVDYLKIDGAFIRDMLNNPLDCAMAEAINKVGQIKGIKTIAEFVESEAIFKRLAELGVNYAQGYFVHRPEPWEAPAKKVLAAG